MSGLDKAIEHFNDSQAKLAAALGEYPQTITNWRNRGVPLKKAELIVEVTDNHVSFSDLEPDLSDSAKRSITRYKKFIGI